MSLAADPRLLPAGTQVLVMVRRCVEVPWRGGPRVVDDTGRAIRGRRVDIWMPRCDDARAWGRRRVKIHVVRQR